MKQKRSFHDRSAVKGASKQAEVAERLQSYIEYTDLSDLVMSYYDGEFHNKTGVWTGLGNEPN